LKESMLGKDMAVRRVAGGPVGKLDKSSKAEMH